MVPMIQPKVLLRTSGFGSPDLIYKSSNFFVATIGLFCTFLSRGYYLEGEFLKRYELFPFSSTCTHSMKHIYKMS